MALRDKGAEMGPQGLRLDSEGLSCLTGPLLCVALDRLARGHPLTLNGWRQWGQMESVVTRRIRHKCGAIHYHALPYVALHVV